MNKSLTLVLPDLFNSHDPAQPRPVTSLHAPSMEKILSRGRLEILVPAAQHVNLAQLFGLESAPNVDLPVGAVSRNMDERVKPDDFWFCADPVYLHPDLDQLVLTDPRELEITEHEASELAAFLVDEFADLGWEFYPQTPARWLVRVTEQFDVRTLSVAEALIASVNVSEGADATRLHSRINEIQMLLFEHEVNQRRIAAGQLPINSLWFWGGGTLPVNVSPSFDVVMSDDPFIRGLGQLAGARIALPPSRFDELSLDSFDQNCLIQIESPDYSGRLDETTERKTIDQWEGDWFAPLWQSMRRGELTRIEIQLSALRCQLTRSDMRRFWRRRKSVEQWLKGS